MARWGGGAAAAVVVIAAVTIGVVVSKSGSGSNATSGRLGPEGIAAQVEGATGTPAADVLAATAESNPLGRLLRPEEVAETVVFLASTRAGAITGTDIRVDGGYIQTM